MVNYEFYRTEFAKRLITSENRIRTFAVNKKGEIVDCHGDPENTSFEFGPCRNCIFKDSRIYGCKKARMNWLMEEHEEPEEIDWSKVSVGTPILVKRGAGDRCFKQYFKEYKNEKISTWDDPERTHECILDWAPEFAKLAEE